MTTSIAPPSCGHPPEAQSIADLLDCDDCQHRHDQTIAVRALALSGAERLAATKHGQLIGYVQPKVALRMLDAGSLATFTPLAGVA